MAHLRGCFSGDLGGDVGHDARAPFGLSPLFLTCRSTQQLSERESGYSGWSMGPALRASSVVLATSEAVMGSTSLKSCLFGPKTLLQLFHEALFLAATLAFIIPQTTLLACPSLNSGAAVKGRMACGCEVLLCLCWPYDLDI